MRKTFVPNYRSADFQIIAGLLTLFRTYDATAFSRWLPELTENRISQLFLKQHASELKEDPELLSRLNQVKNEILFNNLYYLNQLKKVLTVFSDKQIDVVVLKGLSLINHLYGDVSMRTFVDLDFLVRKKDLFRFVDALLEMGYIPDYGSKDIHTTKQFTAYNPATRVNIDILLRLDADPFPNRYFPLDEERIWERKCKIRFDEVETSRLSLEDELVYHIYHMAFHLYFEIELKWVFDLYYFLEKYDRELDKAYLNDRFRELGFQHLLRAISDLIFWAFQKEYASLSVVSVNEPNPLQRTWMQYYIYPPRLFAKIKQRRNFVSRMSHTLLKFSLLYGFKRKGRFVLDRLLPGKSRLNVAFKEQIVLTEKLFYPVIQLAFYLLSPLVFLAGLLYYLFLTIAIRVRLQRWRCIR